MGLFILIVGVAVFVIFAVRSHLRTLDRAWRTAAERLGMQYSQSSMFAPRKISGHSEGMRVRVDTYTKSSGKSSNTFTRYRIYFEQPLTLGLDLKPQGFFSEVAAIFGAQDIVVGDAQFDREVIVRGTDSRGVVAWLTPARRRTVLELFGGSRMCEIRDSGITWSLRGSGGGADKIVSSVGRLVRAAAAMASGVEVERPAAAAPRAPEPPPVEVSEPILPAPEVARAAPEILEVSEPVVTSPPVSALDVGADSPSAETVGEALFGVDVMSFDANRIFDKRFDGRAVRWSGTLQKASTCTIDVVFGGRPGARLTVDVHEVDGHSFGRMVQAVIQLPDEALADLPMSVGESIRFEGHLVKCDPLMRKVYVGDGRVL